MFRRQVGVIAPGAAAAILVNQLRFGGDAGIEKVDGLRVSTALGKKISDPKSLSPEETATIRNAGSIGKNHLSIGGPKQFSNPQDVEPRTSDGGAMDDYLEDAATYRPPLSKKDWQAKQWEGDRNPETTPVPGGTGPDNTPGIYATKREPAWFEKGKFAKTVGTATAEDEKFGAVTRAGNINVPEYQNNIGSWEIRPPGSPGVAGMRKYDEAPRTPPGTETVNEARDLHARHPAEDHHPFYDYVDRTNNFESKPLPGYGNMMNWDLQKSVRSLYKQALSAIPVVKQYYWLPNDVPNLARHVRRLFDANKHVKDHDAIRSILVRGWGDYTDIVTFRMNRQGVSARFSAHENNTEHIAQFAEAEKELFAEKAWWQGAEQKADGPYEGGLWSDTGVLIARWQKELAGRTTTSQMASKGYFDPMIHDGTNWYEKNIDYEGWTEGGADPDRANQRRERANQVAATYLKPKHTISKERRQYRRKVKDYENHVNQSMLEIYASKREIKFQKYMTEHCDESNRLYAEKKLSQEDDDMFTKNWELIEPIYKQVYREFPNPRMWKSDAFYARLNYLLAPVTEYNWARAPVGLNQEKQYNEWVSNTVNYAVRNSSAFDQIKSCKKRNPMAQTPAEFYAQFDPDVPDTRRMPWFHKDFDYDRRRKWDEWCMRQKKWVASGDVDAKNGHFEAEYEENINIVNTMDTFYRNSDGYNVRNITAARKSQLYRALIRRNDIALTNQMVAELRSKNKNLDTLTAEAIADLAVKYDWSKFKFEVPVVIYPDGWTQPPLGLDGTPIGGATATPPAPAAEEPTPEVAPASTEEATAEETSA